MRVKQRKAPTDEMFHRTARINRADINEEKREVSVAFSSETDKIKNWGMRQILLHETSAADLTQLRDLGSVLLNHDPAQVIGRPEDVRLDLQDRKGRARIIFDDDAESMRIFRKIQSGSLKGISVGFKVDRWETLEEGQTWQSPEGRTFSGPADIATQWKAMEFSVTPIPADGTVGVGRSATTPSQTTEVFIMNQKLKDELVKRGLAADATDDEAQEFALRQMQTPPPDPPTPPVPDAPVSNNVITILQDSADINRIKEEAARAERARVKEIRDICDLYACTKVLADNLIETGATPDQARNAVIDTLKRERPIMGGPVRVDFGEDERDKWVRAATDRLMLRTTWGKDVVKDDRRIQAASEVRARTLLDLAEESLRRTGQRVINRDVDDIIRRAISASTSDYPFILSTVANKRLQDAYAMAPATWRALCKVESLPDFKSASRPRLGDGGELLITPELMPMPEGFFAETEEHYALATYSKRFGISRQAIVNDDLSAFERIPTQMGMAAARVPGNLFWALLVSASGVGPTMTEDGLALFATTHTSGCNYTTGANVISIASLAVAKNWMRQQRAMLPTGSTEVGAPLNLTPQYLVVPAILEAIALQFTTQITPAAAANVSPAWQYALTVLVEPRLDAATNGTTAWYMVSTQCEGAVMGFLNGNENPTMVRVEGTNILGIEWGVYLDCGTKFLDHRGWYRSRGA